MHDNELEDRIRTTLRAVGDALPVTITSDELGRRLTLRRRARMRRRAGYLAAAVGVVAVGGLVAAGAGWFRPSGVGTTPAPSDVTSAPSDSSPAPSQGPSSGPSDAGLPCTTIGPAEADQPPALVLGATPGDAIAYGGALGAYQLGTRQDGRPGSWTSIDPEALTAIPAGPPTRTPAGPREQPRCLPDRPQRGGDPVRRCHPGRDSARRRHRRAGASDRLQPAPGRRVARPGPRDLRRPNRARPRGPRRSSACWSGTPRRHRARCREALPRSPDAARHGPCRPRPRGGSAVRSDRRYRDDRGRTGAAARAVPGRRRLPRVRAGLLVDRPPGPVRLPRSRRRAVRRNRHDPNGRSSGCRRATWTWSSTATAGVPGTSRCRRWPARPPSSRRPSGCGPHRIRTGRRRGRGVRPMRLDAAGLGSMRGRMVRPRLGAHGRDPTRRKGQLRAPGWLDDRSGPGHRGRDRPGPGQPFAPSIRSASSTPAGPRSRSRSISAGGRGSSESPSMRRRATSRSGRTTTSPSSSSSTWRPRKPGGSARPRRRPGRPAADARRAADILPVPWGYSSAGRAPAWHAGGPGFESP